jgi:elongation factor G
MKTYTSNQIRNIALLGNSGSGKTSLGESILFVTGAISRKGDVSTKNTVSDYKEIEQNNGNSIFSSVLTAEFKDNKINVLDTPGLDDFCNGVVSSLYVAECGVVLVNAQNGFEVGTEIHSRHAAKFNRSLIYVLNQVDHEKANIDSCLEQFKERLGAKMVITQYPIASGADFNAIVDIISKKLYKYGPDGGKAEIADIPASENDKVEELYGLLVEKAAESDESLMEIFFDKGTLTEEEMMKGLKAGVKNRNIFPVLCVSAKKNIGIDRFLDVVSSIVPDPTEGFVYKNSEENEIVVEAKGAPSAYIFKTVYESHVGEVNYLKVITGELTEALDINNNSNNSKERLSQLFVSVGKNRTKVDKIAAGDICAVVKMKNSKVNQTLSNAGNWKYLKVEYPEPKFRAAIKTVTEGEEEKLSVALNQYQLEDPTIKVEYSKELKQTIIYGQGEYHLNILKWHLDNIFKIPTEYYDPKIPYRETITKVAQADYRHKKQSGGAGQFGEVHMVIEPHDDSKPDPTMYKIDGKEFKISVRGKEEHVLPWGGKLVFYNCIVGGSIDARFLPAILKGIMERMEEGPLTGSYARDIRVAVYDGKMHPVDSNEISFRLAGRNAFKEAFKKAGPKILEPIYEVQVLVPSEKMGDVMSD